MSLQWQGYTALCWHHHKIKRTPTFYSSMWWHHRVTKKTVLRTVLEIVRSIGSSTFTCSIREPMSIPVFTEALSQSISLDRCIRTTPHASLVFSPWWLALVLQYLQHSVTRCRYEHHSAEYVTLHYVSLSKARHYLRWHGDLLAQTLQWSAH